MAGGVRLGLIPPPNLRRSAQVRHRVVGIVRRVGRDRCARSVSPSPEARPAASRASTTPPWCGARPDLKPRGGLPGVPIANITLA